MFLSKCDPPSLKLGNVGSLGSMGSMGRKWSRLTDGLSISSAEYITDTRKYLWICSSLEFCSVENNSKHSDFECFSSVKIVSFAAPTHLTSLLRGRRCCRRRHVRRAEAAGVRIVVAAHLA